MIKAELLTQADLGKTVYVPVMFTNSWEPERKYRVWKQARICNLDPLIIGASVNGGFFQFDPALCEWNPPPEAVVL